MVSSSVDLILSLFGFGGCALVRVGLGEIAWFGVMAMGSECVHWG